MARPNPSLSPHLAARAQTVADALLSRRYTRAQVIDVMTSGDPQGLILTCGVTKGFVVTKLQAQRAVDKVQRAWKEASEQVREDSREYQLRTLDDLYRKAYESDQLRQCVEVQKLIAQIEGNLAPVRVETTAKEADEFSDRSEEELETYAATGYWPEQGVH